jgi:L-seryl-tRNA(Ser) seleniumtransferase
MPVAPRWIPSIEVLRQRPDAAPLERTFGRDALVAALRDAAAELREGRGDSSGQPSLAEAQDVATWVLARAAGLLGSSLRPSLVPVINATGVIVHTNLGRAPLAGAAIARVAAVAKGYTNLEYDLEAGARGRRDAHAEALLRRLTGAEAAVVVNNNAAATLLVLAALASGREVVVSRAELVEIGGGFRVPDVMRQSGATLREVGTTNRTRVADYAAAISAKTALLLRVHPSNFRIEGFTERPDPAALVALARRFRVPIVEDLGSGHVLGPALGVHAQDLPVAGRPVREEPSVADSLAIGHDLVCVSGDKLLGGPQAGLILGRADLVQTIARHPLMRAVRVDKLVYAALEATLVEHLTGRARETIPVARMIATPRATIEARARAVARRLATCADLECSIVEGTSTVGGGSAPGSSLPTALLAVEARHSSADTLDARLRAGSPPVVARIEDGRVVFDMRTVAPEDDDALVGAIQDAVTSRS